MEFGVTFGNRNALWQIQKPQIRKKIYLIFFFIKEKTSVKTRGSAGIPDFTQRRAPTCVPLFHRFPHHAPFASAMPPSHLHARLAFRMSAFASRVRMPLGAFARTIITPTTQSRQSQPHSAHSHFAFAFAFACAFHHPAVPPSSPRSPPRSTSPPHHQPPLRCFCLLLLAFADRFASSESPSAQPQAFSTQRNAAHHHHHHHHTHPHSHCHPFGTALHRFCCLPPADHTGAVLCKHRAKPPCSTPPLTALHRQLTPPPLLIAVTLHGTCALAHHRCLARTISGTYGHRAAQVPCAHCK